MIMEFAGLVHRRWGVMPTVVIPGGGFGIADDASGADVPIDEWANALSSRRRPVSEVGALFTIDRQFVHRSCSCARRGGPNRNVADVPACALSAGAWPQPATALG